MDCPYLLKSVIVMTSHLFTIITLLIFVSIIWCLLPTREHWFIDDTYTNSPALLFTSPQVSDRAGDALVNPSPFGSWLATDEYAKTVPCLYDQSFAHLAASQVGVNK